MATTDFRFRVSKAVGSPSVQGAAGIETLANHTENPHPHPQYMRKSYVGMGMTFTEHFASRTHHARNHALRDELTTSKLEYERYKLISLVHDADNYLADSGIKAHVITAYVLNQILGDVGLDGSAEALTYNNLINSYDTHVANAQRFAPTWEIFLKLRNSIYPWMINGTPENYVLKSTWREWVEYMYGETEPDTDVHPLRPGLKVALYSMDRLTETFNRPTVDGNDPVDYARLVNRASIPSLATTLISNGVYYLRKTTDATPVAGKEYYYVVDKACVPFTGSTFTSGTVYFEKVYADLKKVQGDAITNGCGILETSCTKTHQEFFDWSNGQKWRYYAGDLGHANDPYGYTMMVFEGRIKLRIGQTIKFAGCVDDYVLIRIGSTVLTKQDNTNYWSAYYDHVHCDSYDTAPVFSYTAAATGLYTFTLAIANKLTIGPRISSATDNFCESIPLRMSLDGGATYVPVVNESLDSPIFFLPEGSEKKLRDTQDARDKFNYRPDRKPGLLLRMWKSAAVSRTGTIDVTTEYPIESKHVADLKHLGWKSISFVGDKVAASGDDRLWTSFIGPHITNGCYMLTKCCNVGNESFFDWFNGLNWTYFAGLNTDSLHHPWARRAAGWFGTIFLHKGETVAFKGRVEDHFWIKIDDTWVADGVANPDVYDWDTAPEYSFTADYTGYHPFTLIARNATYVGPKRAGECENLMMSLNGGTYVDIGNDSFDVPRFFLPDDCDHDLYWNEGITLRDKAALATSMMRSGSTKHTSYKLNNLAKKYGPLTINSRKYDAWQLEIGKTYASGTDTFSNDVAWNGREARYVSVDVGFRDDDTGVFDCYMYLWTPDDETACAEPSDSDALDDNYFGTLICLQHGTPMNAEFTQGRAVQQQTLVIPKGSKLTFIVGGNVHDEAGGDITSCHSNIIYFWNNSY